MSSRSLTSSSELVNLLLAPSNEPFISGIVFRRSAQFSLVPSGSLTRCALRGSAALHLLQWWASCDHFLEFFIWQTVYLHSLRVPPPPPPGFFLFLLLRDVLLLFYFTLLSMFVYMN